MQRREGGAATARGTAVGLAVVCLVCAAAVAVLMASGVTAGASTAELARGVVAGLAYGVLGAAVALQAPRNAVGWVMLTVGLSNALSSLAGAVAHQRLVDRPGDGWGGWAYWLSSWSWVPGYALVPAVLLVLLPTGRVPGPRWRALRPLGLAVTVLATLAWATTPYAHQDVPVPPEYGALGNPAGVTGAQVVLALCLPVLAGCALAGLTSLVLRMRRRSGREREQVAWVLTGGLVTVGLLVLAWVVPGVGPGLVTVAMLPLPACIAWATLRRRLWDADPVVNRGLVTAVLLGSLALVYVLVLAVAGPVLQGRTRAADLVAFLAAAALVQPLGSRVQVAVNRLLYGEELEPHRAVSRLGEQLQAASSPRQALQGVVEVVARALGTDRARLTTTGGPAVSVGPGPEPGGSSAELLPVLLRHQGRTVGELEVQPPPGGLGRRERQMLEELARHAALAAYAVVLQGEVQRSREQIVGSREEERRRLRHDLHDDLGPGLAATALELETASELVERDPDRARVVLQRAAGYLRSSVADVRRIVDDLRPVALGELGLVGALTEHAARLGEAGLSGVVRTGGDLGSLPAAAEVAAYRIATEAMTNVVRHARATTVEVRLERRDGWLEVRVVDDGVGLGAQVAAGVGLTSMHQRAAELGGSCVVADEPEGGTVVHARIPVADPADAAPRSRDRDRYRGRDRDRAKSGEEQVSLS